MFGAERKSLAYSVNGFVKLTHVYNQFQDCCADALSQGLFGMLSSAAPAVSALAGFVILGEVLTTTQWTAIALIVLASAAAAWSARSARAS